MGCASERFGPEEESLKPKMLRLGFEKHNIEKVVTTILRSARPSETLTDSQFTAIQGLLELQNSTMGPQFREVYGVHFIGQSVYVILVTGIYLSSGSAHSKATALFEIYDTATEGKLDSQRVEKLIEEMFSVATTVVRPLFAEVGRKELNYFSEVEGQMAKAVDETKKVVLQGSTSISKADFVSRLASFRGGLLLEHAGLRKFMKDQKASAPA